MNESLKILVEFYEISPFGAVCLAALFIIGGIFYLKYFFGSRNYVTRDVCHTHVDSLKDEIKADFSEMRKEFNARLDLLMTTFTNHIVGSNKNDN